MRQEPQRSPAAGRYRSLTTQQAHCCHFEAPQQTIVSERLKETGDQRIEMSIGVSPKRNR
jgi:hypothetical protein